MRNVGLFLLASFLLAPDNVFGQAAVKLPSKIGEVHLQLGNPSKAVHDVKEPLNYLMVKDQFALSYNDKKGGPNWVSYHLTRKDMGRAFRPDGFFPDDDLPHGFHKIGPFDYHYNRTGMTRGHMCPNGHRNNTPENAKSTFVMTNMVPQTEELNAGSWEFLERECRNLCFDKNKELFIVCGPHGSGGTSAQGKIATVGDGKVVVPKSCWKVIVVLDAGGTKGPLARINNKTRVIGVLMPNNREPDKEKNIPWTKYIVSVSDIESLTGYSFFDKVDHDIIGPLKKKVDQARNGNLGSRDLARNQNIDADLLLAERLPMFWLGESLR